MHTAINVPMWTLVYGLARRNGALDLSSLAARFEDKREFNILVLFEHRSDINKASYSVYNLKNKNLRRVEAENLMGNFNKLKSSYIITNMTQMPQSEIKHVILRVNPRLEKEIFSVLSKAEASNG
jgi:hypothetical protein